MGTLTKDLIQAIWMYYLLYFYTDVFGISGTAAGTLLLVARIWDAVNDPIMGVLADRSKVRKTGKYRPFVLIMPIPLIIFAVLSFTTPNLMTTGKLIWAYVTYIGTGMAFTAYGVPHQAMLSTLTHDPDERNSMVSIMAFLSTAAYTVASYFALPLVSILGHGSDKAGFRNMMIVVCIVAEGCALITFFATKERYIPETEAASLSDMAKAISSNKPLLILMISMLIGSIASMIPSAVGAYYIIYNLGRSDLVGLGLSIATVGSLVGVAMSPMVMKWLGDIKTILLAYGFILVVDLISFFFAPSSIPLFLVLVVLHGFAASMPSVVISANIVSTSDYAEWKTGVRCDGTAFALQNFGTKFGQAVAGGIGGFLLGMTGYVAGAETQSSATISGLAIVRFIVPAVLGVFAALVMLAYPLTTEKKAEIRKELDERQAKKASTSDV